jgi:cold shock protein
MIGTVARIVKDKRFGFIKAEDGQEYFFYQTGLKNIHFDELEEGREVSFEDVETEKGKRAEDIYV